MDDDQKQDNSDLFQYLKENPEIHQKIIDHKLGNSVFDSQQQNPAVQQDYKQAAIDSDPREMFKKQMMAPPDVITQNMMQGMATGSVGPLTGVVDRGLGEGLKFGARTAAEVAPQTFGKVIVQDAPQGLAKTIPYFDKLTKLIQPK